MSLSPYNSSLKPCPVVYSLAGNYQALRDEINLNRKRGSAYDTAFLRNDTALKLINLIEADLARSRNQQFVQSFSLNPMLPSTPLRSGSFNQIF